MTEFLLSDQAIMDEIGQRLAQRRINSGLTQAELARQAGVGRSTVERLESGRSTQMQSFMRILRVLDLLEQFFKLFPKPGLHPMDLLKIQPKVRQRASSKRSPVQETASKWAWDDNS